MTGALSCGMTVDTAISEWVKTCPENCLPDYSAQPIFDAPLVGVADGDDPLFDVFRTVVSLQHIMPRSLLRAQGTPESDLKQIRVIVWALPFTMKVRRSNDGRSEPSRLYSLARNNGEALNCRLRDHVVQMIRDDGWAAVSPIAVPEYDAFRSLDHVFASTWSERHVAFAAGLGQFGLSAALITPVGSNVRFGSVVTNMPLPVTPRLHDDYRASCLSSGGEVCGKCIDRCPVGAISEEGHDKEKCYSMRQAVRRRHMDGYVHSLKMIPVEIVKSGERKQGYSLGCALCQCGVPCEGTNPFQKTVEGEEDA